MHRSIKPLELIFNINERLYLNSLEGVADEQASERISPNTNPFIWIATHTVWARYNTALMLGVRVENPYQGMFENFKAYDPADKYPTLDVVKEEWKKSSKALREALEKVSEEHLAGES